MNGDGKNDINPNNNDFNQKENLIDARDGAAKSPVPENRENNPGVKPAGGFPDRPESRPDLRREPYGSQYQNPGPGPGPSGPGGYRYDPRYDRRPPRRRRFWPWVAAAAAAVILIGNVSVFRGETRAHSYSESVAVEYASANDTFGGMTLTDNVEAIEADLISSGIDIKFTDDEEASLIWTHGDDGLDREIYMDGNTLYIEEDEDFSLFDISSWFSLSLGSDTHLDIYLPAGMYDNLDISTVSGSVNVEGAQARDIDVDTVSGSITFEEMYGGSDYEFNSTSGSVELYGTGADMSSLTVKTVSGSIWLENISAEEIELDTTSGSMDIDGAVFEGLDMETVSGGAEIRNLGITEFDLEIQTVSGSINDYTGLRSKDSNNSISFESISGGLSIE